MSPILLPAVSDAGPSLKEGPDSAARKVVDELQQVVGMSDEKQRAEMFGPKP
ncbi:hypothetical protein AAFN90_02160 [Erwiniaceae bacterium CAU 1747]